MFNIHIFFVIIATVILVIFAEIQQVRKITWILIIGCIGYIILNFEPNISEKVVEQSSQSDEIKQINKSEKEPIIIDQLVSTIEKQETILQDTAVIITDIILDTLQMAVNTIEIATNVIEREPLGSARLFLNDIEKLFCYTSVNNPFDSNVIVHHWYSNNIEYFNYPMDIGNSDNWRCWSMITIRPQLAGDWIVSATDTLGNILAQTEFTILETEE